MKLTTTELAFVRSKGLYITKKRDGCGKPLNQSLRYTITGKPEVYCSAACRDFASFEGRREAKKHASPGKCVYFGAGLNGKKRDAIYCDSRCRMRANRTEQRVLGVKGGKSRTATSSDEGLKGDTGRWSRNRTGRNLRSALVAAKPKRPRIANAAWDRVNLAFPEVGIPWRWALDIR